MACSHPSAVRASVYPTNHRRYLRRPNLSHHIDAALRLIPFPHLLVLLLISQTVHFARRHILNSLLDGNRNHSREDTCEWICHCDPLLLHTHTHNASVHLSLSFSCKHIYFLNAIVGLEKRSFNLLANRHVCTMSAWTAAHNALLHRIHQS